ncbi:MAG: hypothetical protein JRF52_09860 [Deltaproteobacteria bacterium]|jgi:hypothetical protein|nr:hypothetical protein [Deltaproteobacteria bacterium]
MNTENELASSLQTWKEVYPVRTEGDRGADVHLDMEDLYSMAGPGGIEKADDKALNHLSLCPICLEEWASWFRALRAVDELDRPEASEDETIPVMAYGMREAAATAKPEEPISIRSSCGRFIFGLLPQLDNLEKGMVTLEAVADGDMAVEGRYVTVRDRNGLVVLEGRLRHGRLARICEKLSEIDLTTWTLVVDGKKE